MKCSKCGYISFDYNQVCPKCNKEISGDQGKLNLPAFRPDPPSFLGALTGEHNESQVNLSIDSGSVMGGQDEEDADLEDSVVMESEEMSLDDEEDLDISLEAEDTGEFEEPAEDVITESVSDFDIEGDDEEISLDMDDLSTEESESEEIAPMESVVDEEQDEGELDLDELQVDETGQFKISTPDEPDEPVDKGDEIEMDLEDLDLDLDLEKSDD
jgi:hypothetical protein